MTNFSGPFPFEPAGPPAAHPVEWFELANRRVYACPVEQH